MKQDSGGAGVLTFIAAIFFFFLIAAALNVARRFLTKYTIGDLHFFARIPMWAVFWTLPLTLLGLLIAFFEVAAGRVKYARESIGIRLVVFAGGWFLGAWLGGVVSSYALQFLTGWSVSNAPPVDEKKNEKK